MDRYQPKEIEPKWQKRWHEQGIYQAKLSASAKPKYVAFGMFNYPSGQGIHVGHAKNFTLPDVLLRSKRQQGFEAYSPVGFDAFGLPAENYAIKTGISPRQTTDQAIAAYRRQYQAMGWSQDWSKEIDTSQADYYRWTQWCFLKLQQHGLAYQKESQQWWCSLCLTVLADEQVIAGKCWRHDGHDDPLVQKKVLKQWFFKITELADEILEATDQLNWTPWVKTAQKNWIGRSEGAEVDFELKGLDSDGQTLSVYTTACDTIYGATFMVLAPEHPLVEQVAKLAHNKDEIATYIKQVAPKNELERQQNKDKTGVLIKGLTATNPINHQQLPVWVADYVLLGYGTGAIMAVPGNDQRDYDFAQEHELPIVYTAASKDFVAYADILAESKKHKLIDADEFSNQTFGEAKPKILNKLVIRKQAKKTINYRLRDWLISRQRYWGVPIPIIHCSDCGAVPVSESDLPVELPVIDDYHPSGDGRSPLANAHDWVETTCPKCQQPARRETDTMDGYVCSSWYQLRYLDPNNDQQAWQPEQANRWLPIDFYNGGDHATAHLLYARFLTRFFHKLGLLDTPEPFEQMYFHAKILASDGSAFSKSKGNGVDPLTVIESGYGADALRTYICFISPPDIESPWNEDGVPATFRFLNRCWVLTKEYLKAPQTAPDEAHQAEIMRAVHNCIKKVNDDIAAIKFNTAIAAQMELVNQLYKIKDKDKFNSKAWQFVLESLAMLLAPFAPHIAEELWHQLGHEDTVHIDHWPQLDKKWLSTQTMTIVVQVNGKLRGQLEIARDTPEAEIVAAAQELPAVARHIQGDIKKTVYVAGRLVSLVV